MCFLRESAVGRGVGTRGAGTSLSATAWGVSDAVPRDRKARPLEIVAGDSQLLHHGVRSRARHPEASSHGTNHAAGLPEDTQDVFPLDLFERRAAGNWYSERALEHSEHAYKLAKKSTISPGRS
jgi:hypothetical protein